MMVLGTVFGVVHFAHWLARNDDAVTEPLPTAPQLMTPPPIVIDPLPPLGPPSVPVKPAEFAKVVPSNAKVQDHLKLAKVFREKGEYADAQGELEKARSIDPDNRRIQAEMEITRKVCDAERKVLGRVDLKC